jgi:hypothetical protein
MTMLKTISAALLAASIVAAPALAATNAKTTAAPVTQSGQVKSGAVDTRKTGALNANAKMSRHHVTHARHHRSHERMSAGKTHKYSKVTIKHIAPATKRG